MRERIALFTQGGGIGDAIHLASATEAFVESDPTREYGAVLSAGEKRAWWEAAFADAPFPHWIKAPQAGWRTTRCTPIRLGLREDVISAHVRAGYRKAGISLVEIRRPRLAPAWFGPRPPIEPERVGVFVPDRWRTKLWRGGIALVAEIRRRGERADPAPIFPDPGSAVAWVARCNVFVGPETGLTHLAAAIGIPVVMILGGRFGPENFPWPGATHMTSSCPHGPCLAWRHEHPPPCLRGRWVGEIACLAAIGVDVVADEVMRRVEARAWKT